MIYNLNLIQFNPVYKQLIIVVWILDLYCAIMSTNQGLLERLQSGEQIICAEGYLFEFERRGYLKAGAFVPEVVLEHPHLVKNMHEEFVHSGSDVVEAFTYYGHREKLKLVGREDELEKFNRNALRMAREVADKTGSLMAGNISNTTVFVPEDPESVARCKQVFKEQILLAVEEKADFIIAETFDALAEAKTALEAIKEYAPGLPCVVTLAPNSMDQTYDGVKYGDALQELEQMGADVVGLNCFRGPDSMLPIIKEVRAKCKGPIACLPLPYRTSMDAKCMQDLKDYRTGESSFPVDLNPWLCSRGHIAEFTKQLVELGVQYMGICCGNQAHYTRAMAEALGRTPPASQYSPDMSQHLSQIEVKGSGFAKGNWHKSFDANGTNVK